MKRHIKIRILFFVVFILILLAATACGSKKKVVEKTDNSTKVEVVDNKKEIKDSSEDFKKEETKEFEKTIDSDQEDFYVEIDNPEKDFEIEKETKDGKTTWKGKNIKNLDFNKKRSKDSFKEKNETNEELVREEKSEIKEESVSNDISKTTTFKKDLEVERGLSWIWIILAILLYLIISYFRRTLNPVNWFKP